MTKNNKKVATFLTISLLFLLVLAITTTTAFGATTPPKGNPPPDGSVTISFYGPGGDGETGGKGGKDRPDTGNVIEGAGDGSGSINQPIYLLEPPTPHGELVHVLNPSTGGPQGKLPATGSQALLLSTLTLIGMISLGLYAYSNRKSYACN